MATFGTPKRVDFSHLRLRHAFVSSINDTQTITTGIPNIQKVLSRTGSGANHMSGTGGPTLWTGAAATGRRVQAFLTNQATGEITFDTALSGSTTIIYLWAPSST